MSTNSSLIERGTIYTLGYSQRKAAATLDRLLRQPRTLLLDVRYQPVSRWNPEWNQTELVARYGEQYRWERRLGNVNYWSRDRGIQLPANSQEAVHEAAALLLAGTSLVLLCCCGDERACHRSYVAKLIQDALPAPRAAREVRA
jgi:uncharacterized protein (DUF488 family)